MKKNSSVIIIILISFLLVRPSYTQQDYQIVQNFKDKAQQVENNIRDADSLSQLVQISSDIEKLKDDYSEYKNLLDKSLYPEDFNSSIGKLSKQVSLRRGDFTQITVLQTQVVKLKESIRPVKSKK